MAATNICLASNFAPFTQAGVSVFALSIYDTDYVLVKAAQWNMALEVLQHHHTIATGLEELLG